MFFWGAFLCVFLPACKSPKQLASEQAKAGQIEAEQADDWTSEPHFSATFNEDSVYKYLEAQKKQVPVWAPKKSTYKAEKPRPFLLINTILRVRFDWEKEQLAGVATLAVRPYFYPQDSVVLDAKGFDIEQVSLVSPSDTLALSYNYDDQRKLRVRLPKTYTQKDTFLLQVRYVAKPTDLPVGGSAAIRQNRGLYFINPDGKDPEKPRQIWTQGETEWSSCWFPTFDAPNVKSGQEIYITVDTAFTTISNGLLVSQQTHPNGTRTDYWKMSRPHTPYLFAMAIGKYHKTTEYWRGKEVSYYVEPAYAPYAKDIFGHTPEMMTFFSDKLNYPYPWEKYAQVVVRDFVSGAMENTTVSIFMEELQVTDRSLLDAHWDGIIAHELIHHWFGNLVTCESWANLPLNESFATYGEYLWTEHKYGRAEADFLRQKNLNRYLGESKSRQEPLIRYHYQDKEDMFDNHSYAKGSLILHLLRSYAGDRAFFAALSRYLHQHAYQAAEIHDLRLAFEQVTGKDWNWFFNQWFLRAGHPELFVREDFDKGTLKLTLSQQQNPQYSPIYHLPLKVDIWHGNQKKQHKILLNKSKQTFYFEMADMPDLVMLDPEMELPGIIDHIKTTDAFVQQYKQYAGKSYALARMEAVNQLSNGLDDENILPTLRKALEDPADAIRAAAAAAFAHYEGTEKTEVVAALKQLAIKDKHAPVRTSALRSLTTLGEFPEILKNALKDSSYSVNAHALYALIKIEKENTLPHIERFAGINNLGISHIIADFYAYYQTPGKYDWFAQTIAQKKAKQKGAFINYFAAYLLKQPPQIQQKGTTLLADYAKNHPQSEVRFSAFQALHLLRSVEGVTEKMKEIREKETNENLKFYYKNIED